MAFVVEDGTGLADANSLCTVAFADGYHSDRGNSAWTGADAVKEQALVRVTDYIVAKVRQRMSGCKRVATQRLPVPRYGLYDEDGFLLASDEVPLRFQEACAEGGPIALSEALEPDYSRDDLVKRDKLDVIETEYFPGTSPEVVRTAIWRRLSGLLVSAGATRRLVLS